jgi:hypothetical protein
LSTKKQPGSGTQELVFLPPGYRSLELGTRPTSAKLASKLSSSEKDAFFPCDDVVVIVTARLHHPSMDMAAMHALVHSFLHHRLIFSDCGRAAIAIVTIAAKSYKSSSLRAPQR